MVATAQTSPPPPPVGTLIDNDSLELVQILGYGGYGIVYRAIDTFSSQPTSYAVKCLPHSSKRNAARQRQLHIREITLHQLASAHPGVVTLHRVIEDYDYTWIVMDYCPDGDLFTQILQHRRYLGNNELIKEVFLQLLDAVEYCHSLSIYHRDLKPENILCFDDGLRLAITDFGLATTDRVSNEFRTGSVYHMSPECQGGDFAPTKSYSPLFNDIWSLGIILLNLITGRNPWKSASSDDCTFQAYLRDPRHFLPTVLPISDEVNKLLIRVLEVDWRRRMTLREMRQAVRSITNFYSPDVLFEDSMARCPWEAGVNVDDEGDSLSIDDAHVDVAEIEDFQESEYHSRWSHGSDSEMVFAPAPEGEIAGWRADSSQASQDATCAALSTRSLSPSPSPPLFSRRQFDDLRTPSGPSTYSAVSSSPSIPSPPVTPGPDEAFFGEATRKPNRLTLDIDGLHPDYYAGAIEMLSASSSTMQTALESAQLDGYGPYSAFYIAESEKASTMLNSMEDMMDMMTDFDEEEDVMDAVSAYSYPTIETQQTGDISEPMSARPESPVLGLDLGFPASEPFSAELQTSPNWCTIPSCPPSEHQTPDFSILSFASAPSSRSPSTSSFAHVSAMPSAMPSPRSNHAAFYITPTPTETAPSIPPSYEIRSRKSRLFNPVRLAFTRHSHSRSSSRSRTPSPRAAQQSFPQPAPVFATHWTLSTSVASPQPQSCFTTVAAASSKTPPVGVGNSTGVAEKNTQGMRRRKTRRRLRSARDWFSPGKFFAAMLPSPQ